MQVVSVSVISQGFMCVRSGADAQTDMHTHGLIAQPREFPGVAPRSQDPWPLRRRLPQRLGPGSSTHTPSSGTF